MKVTELPKGAKNLIEDLLDQNNLGKMRSEGSYYFPLCRAARMRMLQEDYEILFPVDLPEPYLSEYYESINQFGGRAAENKSIFDYDKR